MPSPRKNSVQLGPAAAAAAEEEEESSPQVDYGEEWEEIEREEEQSRIAAGRPKKKSSSNRKPRLNLWDDCENMPGAKPNATPVQREYFESRCLKVWKETAKESKAHEQERSREIEREEAECLEDEITDLFEMFPLLDSALIQDIYLCSDRDWDTTVDTLLKLSGESEGLDARVSKPPPRMDDENEFPLLVGKDDWQVVPRYILEEGKEDTVSSSRPTESTSYLAKVGLCMAERRPETDNCTSEEESSSSGDEEVTWNVNEREKRVVIQKSATALKDDEFWSSNLHDTWEEDPDDSSISFDSEDEEDAQWQDVGESSMSEATSGVEEEEGGNNEEEESDDSSKRRRKPNKYVDPALQPKRKKARKASAVEKRGRKSSEEATSTPSWEETSNKKPVSASRGVRGVTTRDTTRAQTVDSSIRETDRMHSQEERRKGRKETKKKETKDKWPSYDELIDEALQVEVWNTRQLIDYISYERELDKMGHHQSAAVKAKKKARETTPLVRWTNSASKVRGEVIEELSFHNGADISAAFPSPSASPVELSPSQRRKYREPFTGETFDTIEEYKRLREKGQAKELVEFDRALRVLETYCVNT
ncbi:hypothetical protein, conserved [Perkinsus marinus ATCC 50983]|uniref:CUE domain-containing protein n=1 Tax=Perkinsus marinus (strain ATCC 50983 / TXsc) TaxID=423536 RepID=C5KKI1_PERM5|nr:hypothetical protein, conserved [Perkinsus marinus ATCC 50983]EER15093.1 hypothetical protein, conserved [Perkinsus marinus ATCC 50983]|eukprot:XP_002783297.1 hypothetical protein, conserved [Perkinsus marinus ATCC 50983]